MLGRQAKVLEAFQRTVQFVKTHVPPNANGAYARLARELEEAVAELEQHAAGQELGRRRSLAATRAMRARVRELRERHLKPLSVMARALVEEAPGIVEAFRLPRRRTSVTRLAADARGVRSSAEKYARLFVAYGRHPAFLSQLDQAIGAMEEASLAQARAKGEHVGATAGLAQGIWIARRLVMLLECQILIGFEEDGAVLAEWRSAKRVQVKPGVRSGEVAEVTVSEADEVVVAEREVLLLEAPKPPLLITAPKREKVAA